MKWTFKKFLIATHDGIKSVEGYIYRGLGIHLKRRGNPPLWTVTHLRTGHRILFLRAAYEKAISIATELAEVTEWDFDGLYGWKNRDPDIKAKVTAIEEKYIPYIYKIKAGIPKSEAQAREIMMKQS